MSSYWSSGFAAETNEGKVFIMHFDQDHPDAQSFSPQTTPEEWKNLWNIWQKEKAVNLFIFTTLGSDAALGSDTNTASDPRRLEIPLDRCRWEKPEQPVEVMLTPSRMELTTQPLEKSK